RHQAALTIQLTKELDRVKAAIHDASLELHRLHENLARLQYKLDDIHQTKSATLEKHQKALDQLEANKSQFHNTANQLKTLRLMLQSEIDNLTRDLTFTQEVSKELHSNTKAIRNATHKAEAEKLQAEEQKQKQDLYVKRLTKEMEMLTEQVALYNAETSAQAEQTQAAKEALSEAEMQMASLQMARKQLLQEWNSSLVGMRRREEASASMQEAHQLLSQDREIKGYKKTIIKEQEQNEILTRQLKRVQMDNSTTKSQINQKQGQQEALQTHYSTCLRTLQETERTLETSNLESEVKDQRRQSEKESALRLELEDNIVFAMQQKLTHNKAAKNSQKLSDYSVVAQLSDQVAKMSSFMFFIGQKQSIITKLKKKIDQITEATGHEDLSPLQVKVDSLKAQIEDLEGNVRRDHHLWIKKQGTLMGQTQELETASKNILQLQTEQTCMQQEKIRIESMFDRRRTLDEKEIQKNTQMLRGDLTKLSTLLNKNKQLSQALELDNTLMQMDFIKKVKEKELESIELQLKLEKTAEEKERLLNCLVEAERQIMLWEKKIQIVKETYSAVQGVEEQAEIQRMKAEIHRMEVNYLDDYPIIRYWGLAKKLKSVLDNSYKPLSNSASIEAALQTQMERVHTVSTILHRVCQDFPQHQGALRKLTLALAAHSQEREPELEVS
uniref:Coiled-coil domain containing 40 n=1 Tax=Neogobius melanostomus TaxID=47308 RepID=A0A8C6SDG8_9GOBI